MVGWWHWRADGLFIAMLLLLVLLSRFRIDNESLFSNCTSEKSGESHMYVFAGVWKCTEETKIWKPILMMTY